MNIKLTEKEIKKFGLFIMILAFLMLNIITDFVLREVNIIVVLISCIVLVYKSKNEIGSCIIFLFLLFSMIQIAPEFLFDVRTTAYYFYYEEDLYNIVITILMVFTSTLSVFYNKREKNSLNLNFSKQNQWVFSIALILCIYILIFGINRGLSSSYNVRIKTIYEYFIMSYGLAFYYSSKKKISNFALLFLGFCYIIQDFFYGGRISSVQLVILITILFFPKMKFKQIIAMLIPSYIILNTVEVYRVNYSFANISLFNMFKSMLVNPLVNYKWNTFSEVLYSSSGLVYAKNAVYTLLERLNSFTDFIINIFFGGIRPFGNIVPYISQNISPVGGGGFLPVYFYFWLGWLGVIIISFFVVKLLNLDLKEKSGDLRKIMYILILAMFPRWFYYSPLILFRFLILNLIILYVALKVIDTLTKKQYQSHKWKDKRHE